MSLCERYVDLAVAQQDLSDVQKLAIWGQDYVTIAADSARRPVTEERHAGPSRLAQQIRAHGGDLLAIASISIDMSPFFVARALHNAQAIFLATSRYRGLSIRLSPGTCSRMEALYLGRAVRGLLADHLAYPTFDYNSVRKRFLLWRLSSWHNCLI